MLIQYESDHGDINEMSALQGNTFDREYTAEVSADG
jgi:hypothetical protein